MSDGKSKKLDFKFVALSGTNGSGKDTLGHLLEDRYEFKFLSVSDVLREEAIRRNQEVNRKTLHEISAEWRRERGLAVLVDKAVEAYGEFKENHNGLVIASIRNPGEADEVHRLGGTLVWVDADPEIRYARVQFANRGRSVDDDKTFEEFIAEEEYEMNHTGDEATLNLSGVKERADITIFNNSTELDHFIRTIEQRLSDILSA